jgi:hypothetical protein
LINHHRAQSRSVWCSSCPPLRQKAKWIYDKCINIHRRREKLARDNHEN